MEGSSPTTGTSSGNNRLIGGIAIEPNVVQGKDPTAIASGNQSAQSNAITLSMDVEPTRNPALPIQPAIQPEAVSRTTTLISPGKKPRGRPRKVPTQASMSEGDITNPIIAKRGRGRPKKGNQGSNAVKNSDVASTERDGPSITDTDYNPSCIDKLMEDMMSKKKPTEQSKRPVGRPRKRPIDVKQPVKTKKLKGEMSTGNGKKSTVLDNLFAIIPEDETTNLSLSTAAKVNSEPSKLQISKEMVDKMIGKMKSGQASEVVVPPDEHKPASPSTEVEDHPQPQKRGRGRPKKGEEKAKPQTTGSPVVKRPRGRPKKVLASATVEAEDSPVKKRRGRPKKVVTQTEAKPTVNAIENGGKLTAKRKRGRPPKISATAQVATKQQECVGSEGAITTQVAVESAEAEASSNCGVETEDNEQDVMGKLQVSFSESESEGSDPIDATIDALTHRVVPPPKPAPQQNNSPLFLENQFEESFDEDSDN